MLSKLLLLLFSLLLLSENASIRKRYLLQTENGKYNLALPANPNNNGKATKNREVKVPAGKKRDKEKCEPTARCSVKKKASGGDYDTAMVSCGNHEAKNCAACPQGHGAGRCNGDCVWKDDQCHHGPTTVASTVPTTVPITAPTRATTVPTAAPVAVPSKCGSGRGRYLVKPNAQPCLPGTEITTSQECRKAAHYLGYGLWPGALPHHTPLCLYFLTDKWLWYTNPANYPPNKRYGWRSVCLKC